MDVETAPGASSEPHPIGRNHHLKRVSLLIHSKKYPGQTFVGYALLHEFNPKRLSFFTAQKFPVDDELEVDLDYFGSKSHFKVLMTHIHEQISSGRVMNAVPDQENAFPVRKFYRCYAAITALTGALPTMDPVDHSSASHASADAGGGEAASPGADAQAGAEGEPAVANAGDSLIAPSDRPPDADEVAAKLAALSSGENPAPAAGNEASAAEAPPPAVDAAAPAAEAPAASEAAADPASEKQAA